MKESIPSEFIAFETPNDLSDWLKDNHATANELWVKIFKKNSGIQSITWNELVIELLCWGWIDGIKKSISEQAYIQRITPRTARSIWSKKNTEHVERLIIAGRIHEAGLRHIRAAKADGRWSNAYQTSEMAIPKDFLDALENQPNVKDFFETLNKSERNVIALGLTSAKKPETRQKRFDHYMASLLNGYKPK